VTIACLQRELECVIKGASQDEGELDWMRSKGTGRRKLWLLAGLLGPAILASVVAAEARELRNRADWTRAAVQRITSYAEIINGGLPHGLTGKLKVLVWSKVAPDGTLSDFKVLQSGGHDSVDKYAVLILRSSSPLPPLTPDMLKDTDKSITVPIVIDLTRDRNGALKKKTPQSLSKDSR